MGAFLDWLEELHELVTKLPREAYNYWAYPPQVPATLRVDSVTEEGDDTLIHLTDYTLRIHRPTRRLSWSSAFLVEGGWCGEGIVSAALPRGAVLLMLPGFPFGFPVNLWWAARERVQGMSRHSIRLLQLIGGQLATETRRLLEEALKDHWLRHTSPPQDA